MLFRACLSKETRNLQLVLLLPCAHFPTFETVVSFVVWHEVCFPAAVSAAAVQQCLGQQAGLGSAACVGIGGGGGGGGGAGVR